MTQNVYATIIEHCGDDLAALKDNLRSALSNVAYWRGRCERRSKERDEARHALAAARRESAEQMREAAIKAADDTYIAARESVSEAANQRMMRIVERIRALPLPETTEPSIAEQIAHIQAVVAAATWVDAIRDNPEHVTIVSGRAEEAFEALRAALPSPADAPRTEEKRCQN